MLLEHLAMDKNDMLFRKKIFVNDVLMDEYCIFADDLIEEDTVQLAVGNPFIRCGITMDYNPVLVYIGKNRVYRHVGGILMPGYVDKQLFTNTNNPSLSIFFIYMGYNTLFHVEYYVCVFHPAVMPYTV